MNSEDNLPKLGLVITQKNEVAILNYNIEYHRHMGISHFYIFDDGSTDTSMNTVPDAEGIYKFHETDFLNIPDEMESIRLKALDGNWMGRQILNTYKALQLAKKQSVDWLFFIDADELVFLGSEKEDSFRKVFSEIELDIDVVHFNTVFEVVQNRGSCDNIFKSSTYFKTPEYHKSNERNILNPMLDEIVKLKGYFGHTRGKQAARVKSNLLPKSSHSFKKRNGDNPKIMTLGQILHYHGCSFNEFIKQNSIRHPSHFIYGKDVPYYPKLFWRNLVLDSGMTTSELRTYYEQWIMFSDEEIARLLVESNNGNPVLINFQKIRKIWNKIEEI